MLFKCISAFNSSMRTLSAAEMFCGKKNPISGFNGSSEAAHPGSCKICVVVYLINLSVFNFWCLCRCLLLFCVFFFPFWTLFCSKTYVFPLIKAGGQSDKLLEIHTHTEFLIVCILAPEKKTLQAAGLRQCCQLRPYAQAFELKEGKKKSLFKSPLPWWTFREFAK